MKLLLALLLTSVSAFAETVASYKTNYTIENTAEHIISNFVDYENACMQGCVYYSPNVAEMKILDYNKTANEFYIWISIKSTKDSQAFSKVTITREGSKKITLTQSQVSGSVVSELAKASGLPHNPLFNSNIISATIVENAEGTASEVDYKISVNYSWYLRIFASKIQTSIQETAESTKVRLESN